MSVKIKICGITNPRFLKQAQGLDIDAIGLMFFEHSRRYISPVAAKHLIGGLNPMIQIVGVFVNPSPQWVNTVLESVPIHTIQFHGDEPNEFCKQFYRPFIKSIPVSESVNYTSYFDAYPDASGFVLDNPKGGGTGQTFNWDLIPANSARPLMIAGGLNVQNVGQLLAQVKVDAIDVSSGIEDHAGEKSIQHLTNFIQVVKGYS